MSEQLITSLTFKNYQVKSMMEWLNRPLHSQQSRSRNRFIKIISPLLSDLEAERVELNKKHCEKDEKGELLFTDDTKKHYKFTPESYQKMLTEYLDLMNETFTIDVLPSNKADIAVVKDIILNIDEKFDTATGEAYDEVCAVFESHGA